MEEQYVADLVERHTSFGVPKCVKKLDKTSAHYLFTVGFDDEPEMVAKVEIKDARRDTQGVKRGFHFNDRLSLSRQAYLCSVLRNEARLPAPEVFAVVEGLDVIDDSFILVEKMPGRTWRHYLEDNDFSEAAYLSSLKHLGAAIAKTQRVSFNTYGAIMVEGSIDPVGVTNFANRVQFINDRRVEREKRKINEGRGALSIKELNEIQLYFVRSLEEVRGNLSTEVSNPVLVMGDLHPMQFLVDKNGKPSGFIDNEFFQSAHPALEMFNIGLQLTNYFTKLDPKIVQNAFFEGFHNAGGQYDPENTTNKKLEDLLVTGQMLVAATAYQGIIVESDALRYRWSDKFRDLTLKSVKEGRVDRIGYQAIIREKTDQPEMPTQP